VCEWAREIEDRGAGEILITSVERDGTLQGYDLALIEAVASAVKIPVIASGGAGTYEHMVDAVKQAGASAVAAASIFHFTEQTPAGAKAAMQEAGIPVRKNFVAAHEREELLLQYLVQLLGRRVLRPINKGIRMSWGLPGNYLVMSRHSMF